MLARRPSIPRNTKNFDVSAVTSRQSVFLADANSQVTTDLSVSIQFWLRKRGLVFQLPMTENDKQKLKECFDMIDTNNSGSLDVKEMFELFETMGLDVDREQVRALVKEVDEDGSGEVEFPEFLHVMHKELYDKDPHESVWKDDIYTDEDRQAAGIKGDRASTTNEKSKRGGLMPLNLVAGAFRRKKVLDAVMMNTGDMRKRLIASGYEYKQRRVDEDRAAQEAAMHAGSSWRAKTEANKIVADRIGTADHPEIDVLNLPFSTDMPKGGHETSQGSATPRRGGAAGGGKGAKSKWRMPRENKQLSQLVDAALVVKQDVHKRVELRERLERFSKRPPVFTEEDRMHFKSEGGMYELVNSEGRSLALAGVVPRQPSLKHKPSSAACRWRAGVSSGMAPRPGSVEWHVQRLGEPHQPAAGSRPSTVPISSLRPVRPTAAEISESLAYKPVPDEEDITAGMGLSSSDEEEPEGSDGPLPEHDSEAAHKGPSRSPTATRQQSPPQPPPRPASRGRDLLQQQREERDAAMRREAVSRQNSGGVIFERLSGARPPWGAAHAMPAATEWDRRQSSPLRSLGKTTEFSGEGQALGGSRGAMGWSWAEGWASGPGSPDASRPATAWVSPFTSRPVSPLARPRSQALGTRDSGWSRRHPGEGAPVWASIHRRLKPRSAAASPGQLTHFPPAPRQSGRRSPGSRGRQRRTTARSATYRALPRAEN